MPRRIEINDDLTPDEMRMVITHEAVHGALSVSGLTNMLPHKVEEAICEMMENLAPDIVEIWGKKW